MVVPADRFVNIKLDPDTGEWVTEGGRVVFVQGLDAIAQAIRCNLRLFLGEWAFDESAGVAYLQKILGKGKPEHAQSEIVRVILRTPGVVAVPRIALDLDRKTRRLRVAFTARTVLGDLPSEVNL